eukprot:3941653-Rhodomonas_salina.5
MTLRSTIHYLRAGYCVAPHHDAISVPDISGIPPYAMSMLAIAYTGHRNTNTPPQYSTSRSSGCMATRYTISVLRWRFLVFDFEYPSATKPLVPPSATSVPGIVPVVVVVRCLYYDRHRTSTSSRRTTGSMHRYRSTRTSRSTTILPHPQIRFEQNCKTDCDTIRVELDHRCDKIRAELYQRSDKIRVDLYQSRRCRRCRRDSGSFACRACGPACRCGLWHVTCPSLVSVLMRIGASKGVTESWVCVKHVACQYQMAHIKPEPLNGLRGGG